METFLMNEPLATVDRICIIRFTGIIEEAIFYTEALCVGSGADWLAF